MKNYLLWCLRFLFSMRNGAAVLARRLEEGGLKMITAPKARGSSLVLSLVILSFVSLFPVASIFAAPASMPVPSQPDILQRMDSELIRKDSELAKPMILPISRTLDRGVDYSSHVTLTGNQDGWGGCIGRSLIHVIDILNEMKHPYAPDLSFWYFHIRQEQAGLDGFELVQKYGLCRETDLPSNYDKAKFYISGYGVDGIAQYFWDWRDMPQPTPGIDAFAARYKAWVGLPQIPEVEDMKYCLATDGPILAAGPLVKLSGNNPREGHSVAVVGYSDARKSFKCLNSWGDTWNNDGYFEIGYDEIKENFTSFRRVVLYDSDPDAFTARIWIDGLTDGRKKIVVRIGMEDVGDVPVWNAPNQVHCVDDSRYLKIDVPMPILRIMYPNKRWYVEITNTGSGNIRVLELTLARRGKDQYGKPVTKLQKYVNDGEFYIGSNSPGSNQPATKRYYFPLEGRLQVSPQRIFKTN
jgi:Cysteine protease